MCTAQNGNKNELNACYMKLAATKLGGRLSNTFKYDLSVQLVTITNYSVHCNSIQTAESH